MKRLVRLTLSVTTVATFSALCGCSTNVVPLKNPERKTFTVSYRHTAPQPVYSRVRWVYLPDVVPMKDGFALSKSAPIDPVVSLQLKNTSLPEAMMSLANIVRYRAECPSQLESVKVSLNAVGTIEELAQQIAKQAGEEIVVDHVSRVVRIQPSPGAPVAPELFEEKPLEPSFVPGAVIDEGSKGPGY